MTELAKESCNIALHNANTNANRANDSTTPTAINVFPKIEGCFADACIAVDAHFP